MLFLFLCHHLSKLFYNSVTQVHSRFCSVNHFSGSFIKVFEKFHWVRLLLGLLVFVWEYLINASHRLVSWPLGASAFVRQSPECVSFCPLLFNLCVLQILPALPAPHEENILSQNQIQWPQAILYNLLVQWYVVFLKLFACRLIGQNPLVNFLEVHKAPGNDGDASPDQM